MAFESVQALKLHLIQTCVQTCSTRIRNNCGFQQGSAESINVNERCTQECADHFYSYDESVLQSAIQQKHINPGSLIQLYPNVWPRFFKGHNDCGQFGGPTAQRRSTAVTARKETAARLESSHDFIRDFNLVSAHTNFMGGSIGNPMVREAWMMNALENTQPENVELMAGGLLLAALSLAVVILGGGFGLNEPLWQCNSILYGPRAASVLPPEKT